MSDSNGLADKVRLLSGRDSWNLESVDASAPGVAVADGPHGLRRLEPDQAAGEPRTTRPATCFPTAPALASSWDVDLLHQVGDALAAECRAEGVSVLLGPGLNIKRHPRGGRNFEYLSEDPFLSGKLAAAMVRGVQARGVAACIKHFAANNHEAYRNVANVVVDERTLREIYLRGFEIVVREADPWTAMCAYNSVNGEHCSESRRLLTDILRDEWGFDGLVMSDWGATNDRAAGIAAGLDLQMPGCGGAFDAEVIAAVDAGRLAERDLDRAIARVARLNERTRTDPDARGADEALHDAHHQVARRAAAAGTVLLSNTGVLPLDSSAQVALLGAFAETPRYQGAGSSQVNPARMTTLRDELAKMIGDEAVTYQPVFDPATGAATDRAVAEAATAAEAADVAVVVVGLPDVFESEGFDRDDLLLPAAMVALIDAVCAAQPDTVVVLCNGAPVAMGWADRPAAIIEAYLGGQAGGGALADVLTGVVEPGGRLAESIPVDAADLPAELNFPGQPRQTEYRENLFVGYRFHESAGVPARFPFGHGLSYSSFEWDPAQMSAPTDDGGVAVHPAGEALSVTVGVTNTGDRRGSQVVQVYVEAAEPALPRPARELAGFAKIELDAAQSGEAVVMIDHRAFQVFDTAAQRFVTDPGTYRLAVARSSADIVERLTVIVTADDANSPEPSTQKSDAPWALDDVEFAGLLGHPIPTPPPIRPFTRNSTIGDLATTRLGPAIRRAVTSTIRRELSREIPEASDELLTRYEAVAFEAPVRTAVAVGEGRVTLAQADALLDLLNGRFSSAAQGVVQPVLAGFGRRSSTRTSKRKGARTNVRCIEVDADYAEHAAYSFTVEEEIPVTPERIFEIFADPESWPRWVDVISKVTWTSDPPIGVGSTRSVEMLGGFVGHEEYVVWEPPERMAFRFNSTSKPAVEGFLEDYRVIDLGDGNSAVRWTMSMTPIGPGRFTMKPVAPAMGFFLGRTLRSLAKYAAAHP